MQKVEYIFDNIGASKAFVLSLKLKVIRQRFASLQDWNPDNCALALLGGKPVALADCNRSEDGLSAICGLIAHPDFGGYAISALSALKRHTKLRHWTAGVRAPNSSLFGIGRRFLDELYDEGAWELSNQLMLKYRPLGYLRPTPLVISNFHLRLLHLPPIKTWSHATRRQLLEAARAPGTINLVAPSGDELGPLLMTLAFELANTAASTRQNMTRTLMFMMMAMHGIPIPEKMARKFIDQSAPSDFQRSIDLALTLLDSSGPRLFASQKNRFKTSLKPIV